MCLINNAEQLDVRKNHSDKVGPSGFCEIYEELFSADRLFIVHHETMGFSRSSWGRDAEVNRNVSDGVTGPFVSKEVDWRSDMPLWALEI